MKQTLSNALKTRGYQSLTPVQEAVTREDALGLDLLVSARTGSGKTVGFGLAIAPAILGEGDHFGPAGAPLALAIAPTRELALQVRHELEWLYRDAGAVVASCVGGMDPRSERRALERGAHILVATPGRLCDHLRRGAVDLSATRAIVLDEADEMLDMGFREDLETILGAAPEDRLTLMFSATVPPAIAEMAKRFQKSARRISVDAGVSQHADIDYRATLVAERDEENAITNLLRFHEAPNAIVFANTRAAVARIASRLTNRGFSVVSLSGELTQAERSHALQSMRDGRARVCVATDVAARGIDLPNLDLVIHAELPLSDEALLHRSGRTGRAGRKGISALIVPQRGRKRAERLLAGARLTATWENAPSADAVLARDRTRLLADPVWNGPAQDTEEEAVARVLAERRPEEVALAMVRLWQGQRSAPEELVPVAAPRSPGQGFGPSRWFAGPIRPGQRMSPKWIMPRVCDEGGITRDEVGAIRIGRDEFFVEIAEGAVEGFMDALGPLMEIDRGLALAMVDGPPADLRTPRNSVHPARAFGKPARRPREEAYGAAKPDAAGKKPWARPGAAPAGQPAPKPAGKPWRAEGDPARAPGKTTGKAPGKGFAKGAGKGPFKGPSKGPAAGKGRPGPKSPRRGG